MPLGRIFKAFSKLKDGLRKTREELVFGFRSILRGKISEEVLDGVFEQLIAGDVGVQASTEIVERIRSAWKERKIEDAEDVIDFLKAELKRLLEEKDVEIRESPQPPTVILVVGVNGTGKTTSIAKLAYFYKKSGRRVLLAASDTYRAAAIEQLGIWAERIGVQMIKHKPGGDAAAVAYDAAEAALARGADVLIVDTAGRIHTKQHLMQELGKISRVLGKKISGAPHEVLLVLDATTGQNAISQATLFKEATNVTGIVLAKLDGTAKGGIVIAIKRQLGIPVKFIGIGESLEDLESFDAERFVEALFE